MKELFNSGHQEVRETCQKSCSGKWKSRAKKSYPEKVVPTEGGAGKEEEKKSCQKSDAGES